MRKQNPRPPGSDTRIGSALKRGISGGQAKRTNIAIALITDARVLLLDEPTSGAALGAVGAFGLRLHLAVLRRWCQLRASLCLWGLAWTPQRKGVPCPVQGLPHPAPANHNTFWPSSPDRPGLLHVE
jgi:hypothetical protein